MAELTRDIATYLVSESLVNAIGTDIFLDARPDSPDNLVSIFDTGGFPAETSISDLKRTAQVLVRDTSYAVGREKIWAIYKAIDRPNNRVITANGRKMHIKAVQPPVLMDRDASNRTLFIFNVQIWTSRD